MQPGKLCCLLGVAEFIPRALSKVKRWPTNKVASRIAQATSRLHNLHIILYVCVLICMCVSVCVYESALNFSMQGLLYACQIKSTWWADAVGLATLPTFPGKVFNHYLNVMCTLRHRKNTHTHRGSSSHIYVYAHTHRHSHKFTWARK